MKHIGIIAEYNPFHNGHAYQLHQADILFPDRKKVVILSGNFVQRGEPAIFHKFLRTRWALQAGADLILELPPAFATASAELFATAALFSLSATGIVDTLCFGAEMDNLPILTEIAALLVKEPEEYRRQLKLGLKQGYSFPKARALAVNSCSSIPEAAKILSTPNNILAIEYLKAINRFDLPITPCLIPRKGNAYHDNQLTFPYASATAIRNALRTEFERPSSASKVPASECTKQDTLRTGKIGQTHTFPHQTPILRKELTSVLPEAVLDSLRNDPAARPLILSDFYPWLQYALLCPGITDTAYQDMTLEILNKLRQLPLLPSGIEELLAALSEKQYTKTRLQRTMLSILLHIQSDDISHRRDNGWIQYLRILGFSDSGAGILKEMKQTCPLPVITKTAKAKNLLPEEALHFFEEDIRINTLYQQCFLNTYGFRLPSEYEQSPIRISHPMYVSASCRIQ